MNKLKKIIKSLIAAMSGGNVMTHSHTDPYADAVQVVQNVEHDRVSKDLLKGEVTQQVEELRYRNYLVLKEAKNYKYVGDGKAVKNERRKFDPDNISFYQENRPIYLSVLDGLNSMNDKIEPSDKFLLKLTYTMTPRFRIERHVKSFKLTKKGGEHTIQLFVDSLPNKDEITSKGFLNELSMVAGKKDPHLFRRTDLSLVNGFSFVTYFANGEDDLVSYVSCDLSLVSVAREKFRYVLTYTFSDVVRDDLTEKFYCEEMAKKYDNKEEREQAPLTVDVIDTAVLCEQCGNKVEGLDAYLISNETGKVLCLDCMKKEIEKL